MPYLSGCLVPNDGAVFRQKCVDRWHRFSRLGEIYASRRELNKAFKLWNEALSVEPDDVKTLAVMGVHLARNGSVSKGDEYLRKAYKLARENPDVINGYALVMYLAGDYSAARQIVHAGGK